jgi:hypothetical protein
LVRLEFLDEIGKPFCAFIPFGKDAERAWPWDPELRVVPSAPKFVLFVPVMTDPVEVDGRGSELESMGDSRRNDEELLPADGKVDHSGQFIGRGMLPQIFPAYGSLAIDEKPVVQVLEMDVDSADDITVGPDQVPLKRPRTEVPGLSKDLGEDPSPVLVALQRMPRHAVREKHASQFYIAYNRKRSPKKR